MSRICVKNLPKHVAEDRLREFFSRKGEVTDAKLMRTADRKSRQFGFVGFRTEQEAEEAVKYFNGSFMDTSKITCEIARRVGDPNMPRPWSRYSKMQEKSNKKTDDVAGMKSSHVASSKKKKDEKKKDDEKDDPALQEFLQVMQPRSKSKLWANDTMIGTSREQHTTSGGKPRPVDEDDMSKPLGVELNKGVEKKNWPSGEHEAQKPSLVRDVVSDMDYFKSRVKKEWSDVENEEEDARDQNTIRDNDDTDSLGKSVATMHVENTEDNVEQAVNDRSLTEPDEELNLPGTQSSSVDEVLETGRLFVRNLHYTATEEELEEYFGKFGNLSQVHIVVDKDTKRSKGFAFVLYSLPESASRALVELDNSTFQGRLLHVMPAKQKISEKQQDNVFTKEPPKTLKQQRVEEKKASEASGNTRAWNSLFMRPDTVVENIARKFGVSKSDLLDREGDDLAVRIALGETKIIQETKKGLAKAGVNVSALDDFAAGKTDGMKRSNHVILVKNLPYGSSEGELGSMFGKFGSIDKIIFPTTRTLALVVFLEAAEARAAFRSLAYKRYKDAPLYLEWAPGNILAPSTSCVDDTDGAVSGELDVKRVILDQQVVGMGDADVDPDRAESRSVYVKNLNFQTSEESLRKHFSEHIKEGRIRSVRVKKHVKNGKNVSMGFGFIELDSPDTAIKVCQDLQGTVLDGHALILEQCRLKPVGEKPKNDSSSTKLIVRNVAFEATEKDLRQLFSPFGQIKRLRLPRRFGNHRGFSFVEYVTKQEAKNALEALSNTHLYGRRLVLERAKEGESLEELRARTAAHMSNDEGDFLGATKVSKKRKSVGVLDEGSLKFERIAD